MQYCFEDEQMQLNGETLMKSHAFQYLESRVNVDGDLNTKISNLVYKTTVRPVALH